jgi:hypothetical protein
MNDVFGLDRGSARCSIDFNERDLRLVDERRDAFRSAAVSLVEFARGLGVTGDEINDFHMAVEDTITDLFYKATQEIEENTEEARRDLGECEGSLDYIGARR